MDAIIFRQKGCHLTSWRSSCCAWLLYLLLWLSLLLLLFGNNDIVFPLYDRCLFWSILSTVYHFYLLGLWLLLLRLELDHLGLLLVHCDGLHTS